MIPATDIDIDTADRNKILKLFPNVPAMIQRDKKRVKHNTGVYFHNMPSDPFTGLATIDHKLAEQQGFFKIDILNVGLYKDIESPEHLDKLMNTEPMWELLTHSEFTDNLFHVSEHSEVLKRMQPKTVEQLAAVLAIIRPAKRYLLGKEWSEVMAEVWERPADDSYYFKKAHAIAYAVAVVVQMNLLCESVA